VSVAVFTRDSDLAHVMTRPVSSLTAAASFSALAMSARAWALASLAKSIKTLVLARARSAIASAWVTSSLASVTAALAEAMSTCALARADLAPCASSMAAALTLSVCLRRATRVRLASAASAASCRTLARSAGASEGEGCLGLGQLALQGLQGEGGGGRGRGRVVLRLQVRLGASGRPLTFYRRTRSVRWGEGLRGGRCITSRGSRRRGSTRGLSLFNAIARAKLAMCRKKIK
jgi:hypothetical protein